MKNNKNLSDMTSFKIFIKNFFSKGMILPYSIIFIIVTSVSITLHRDKIIFYIIYYSFCTFIGYFIGAFLSFLGDLIKARKINKIISNINKDNSNGKST